MIDSGIIVMKNYIFKNSETDIPACLRIALKVPSGISPGWFGIVV